jgi:hypothetical protein
MRGSPLRAIVAIIGGVFAAGALLLAALCRFPGAVMLAGWAAIFLVGLLIERWRYKRLSAAPPGPDWQRTDERFLDPETGKLVTVYFHPATGERRYTVP